jgi:hypothetical protein
MVQAPDRSTLLTSLLGELAKDSDLEPPTLPSDGIPPRTIDYLLRLIVHPYTTSPKNHPAILKTTLPGNTGVTPTGDRALSIGTFQVYQRCQTTTLAEALADLKKFVSVYDSESRTTSSLANIGYWLLSCSLQGNIPCLQTKIDHLEDLQRRLPPWLGPQNVQVYMRYFGQTIRTDPDGRLVEDCYASAQPSLVHTYIFRFKEKAWECYEFLDFQRKDTEMEAIISTATKDSGFKNLWLRRPDLQDLEYIVTLAGMLGSLNAATGGLPQANHAIPLVCLWSDVPFRKVLIYYIAVVRDIAQDTLYAQCPFTSRSQLFKTSSTIIYERAVFTTAYALMMASIEE